MERNKHKRTKRGRDYALTLEKNSQKDKKCKRESREKE